MPINHKLLVCNHKSVRKKGYESQATAALLGDRTAHRRREREDIAPMIRVRKAETFEPQVGGASDVKQLVRDGDYSIGLVELDILRRIVLDAAPITSVHHAPLTRRVQKFNCVF